MTSYDDQIALGVLTFLAKLQDQVGALRRYLREEAHIAETVSFVECRQYENGLFLSVCVEAEVDVGHTLTWWMDIVPQDDNWLLDARVSWNGQDVVVEFPEQFVRDFHAVQREVPRIFDELIESGKQVLERRSPDAM